MVILAGWNPEAQAETLLDLLTHQFPAQPEIYSQRPEVILDDSDNLWLLANVKISSEYRSQPCLTKISPDGRVVLENININPTDPNDDKIRGFPYSHLACDRYDNLFVGLVYIRKPGASSLITPSLVHLIRVSPNGNIHDFFPWPRFDELDNFHIGFRSDTMTVIGFTYEYSEYTGESPSFRITSALVDSASVTPLGEKVYLRDNIPFEMLQRDKDLTRYYFDLPRGLGFKANIYYKDSTILKMYRFDFRISEESIVIDTIDDITWRDYVWRSYPNSWLGWITFCDYSSGGYLLYMPDPENRSTTHVLRLDQMGEPLDPSTLEDGGAQSSRVFNRLPSQIEPNVYFRFWEIPSYRGGVRDSAQVLFWGCDTEGNLYTYRRVRHY